MSYPARCSLCKNESGINEFLSSFSRLVFVVNIVGLPLKIGPLTSDGAVFDKGMARAARRIRRLSDRKAGSCLCEWTGGLGRGLVALWGRKN